MVLTFFDWVEPSHHLSSTKVTVFVLCRHTFSRYGELTFSNSGERRGGATWWRSKNKIAENCQFNRFIVIVTVNRNHWIRFSLIYLFQKRLLQ